MIKMSNFAQNYGCEHYRRNVKLISPCCHKLYHCRLCHDETENHTLDRSKITVIQCAHCNLKQECGTSCKACGIIFGKYTCLICKLYDNEDKQQFHCEHCGICRVGGRENYFHCKKCNTCLNWNIRSSHKCIENLSRSDCSICLQNMHTSVKSLKILSCGHMIHEECVDMLKEQNILKCPICNCPFSVKN